jgi:hypothetical protein
VKPATFEWNAGGLEYYHIEVSTDPSFCGQVQTLPAQGEFYGGGAPYQSFTPSRTEWARLAESCVPGALCFWKVVGRDAEGNVLMTPPSDFRLTGADSTRPSRRGNR